MSKLKNWRLVNGMTLEQVATLLGTTPSSISRYEAGARTPRPAMLRKISEVTGGAVCPGDFFAVAEQAA